MKKSLFLSAVFVSFVLLVTGCSNSDSGDKYNLNKKIDSSQYGSLSIKYEQNKSRSSVSDIAYARVFVTGTGIEDVIESQLMTSYIPVRNGAATNIEIEDIPCGYNRIVNVNAYDSNKQLINDQVLMAVTNIYTDVNEVSVTKETTALGNVFAVLLSKGEDLSLINKRQLEFLTKAVDSSVSPEKIKAVELVQDYLSRGSSNLRAASYYVDESRRISLPQFSIDSIIDIEENFGIGISSASSILGGKILLNEKEIEVSAGEKQLNPYDFTSQAGEVPVQVCLQNEYGTVLIEKSVTVTGGLKKTPVSNPNELVIYQIMVSAFQDGDSSIGFTQAHGPSTSYESENIGSPVKTTTGGDLQGIINAAEYIKSLGVNAIWLTPIFEACGPGMNPGPLESTGYYAYDYFNVDPRFGTARKLQELIEKYHQLGINVILDGVFGHSGGVVADSPTSNSKDKNAYKYIDNPGINPGTPTDPVDYGNNPNVLKFYLDVAQYWIKRFKIDGWRLDQCYQVGLGDNGQKTLTKGHNYWYEIRNMVRDASAQNGTKGTDWGTLGYMVGEHWDGNPAGIQKGSIDPGSAAGYGLQSCFDFPDRYKIVNALAEAEYDAGGNALGYALDEVYRTPDRKGYYHPEGYIPNLFITNHDLCRFGNLLYFDEHLTPSDDRYWKMHKIMMATMVAYTGPITIYYGDEWGAYAAGETTKPSGDNKYLGNGAYVDNASRTSGKIDNFTTKEQDLISYSSKLIKMRRSHEALWNGDYKTITVNGEFYVGEKSTSSERIRFAINNNGYSQNFDAWGTDLMTNEKVSGSVTVEPYSARFILCE